VSILPSAVWKLILSLLAQEVNNSQTKSRGY
jgi:hypothetical protein